jgi:hypothetical protein
MKLRGTFHLAESTLSSFFDFGYQKTNDFEGYISIGTAKFGPVRTEVLSYTVSDNGTQSPVQLPQGIYLSARVRVTQVGDAYALQDASGANYWSIASTGEWTALSAAQWHQLSPGDTPTRVSSYITNRRLVVFNNPGVTAAETEFDVEVTWLPLVTRPVGTRMTGFVGKSSNAVLKHGGVPLLLKKV